MRNLIMFSVQAAPRASILRLRVLQECRPVQRGNTIRAREDHLSLSLKYFIFDGESESPISKYPAGMISLFRFLKMLINAV